MLGDDALERGFRLTLTHEGQTYTTALIAGSQLGLGQHYTSQADATMAAAAKPAVAQVTVREGRPG